MKSSILISSLLLALIAACSSSPASRFYTLSAIAADNAPAIKTGKRLNIAIGSITLPDSIDRPQLVTQTGPNQVQVHETQRWVNSLKQDFPRILAQDISMRLDGARVAAFPQYVVPDPDYSVQIDVQRFELQPDKAAILEVLWTVHRDKPDTNISHLSQVTEPVSGKGFDALVGAQSRALATISNDIVKAIQVDLQRNP